MNATISESGSRATPNQRLHPSQILGKSILEDHNFQLTLRTAIGTTTSSSCSFDSLDEYDIFAVCAGSAVVVSHVNHELKITQRLFRARPYAQPLTESPSTYSYINSPNTTLRSRLASSMRGSGHNTSSGLGGSTVESPAKSQASKRTKEVTCLSLSRCGKFLAVGERGKTPRILIFSLASDAPLDIPLSVLNEHSFGVRSIEFSHDSRWLCSLGDIHDGYIYVWSINERNGLGKLHSSNKCQNAQKIGWVGHSIISFGIRHVKVWRIEALSTSSPSKIRYESDNLAEQLPGSPAPRTLQGRNCLLGPLIDSVFTCFAAISDDEAVLCTDQGDICLLLLDESECSQRLLKVTQIDFRVVCVTMDKRRGCIWLGGKEDKIKAISLDDLKHSESAKGFSRSSNPIISRASGTSYMKPDILAIGVIRDQVTIVDSDHTVELQRVEMHNNTILIGTECQRMPAHNSAVLGVSTLHQPNKSKSDFLTWSANGSVLFWLFDGSYQGSFQIELNQSFSQSDCDANQLKVVRELCFDDYYVSGDKDGVLRLVNSAGDNISVIKAHSSDVNDIVVCRKNDDFTFIVSCGRDRTLQVFQKTNTGLPLVQTILDHVASVNNIIFLTDGSTLLSLSSDRTIVIRTMVTKADKTFAFVPTRVIALKTSPVAMSVSPNQQNILVVSTMDKQFQKYDLVSGRMLSNLKISDPSGNDSVILGSLLAQNINVDAKLASLILGVSSSDRSIRIYEHEYGSMLAKEHGQLMVSSMAFFQKNGQDGDVTNLIISGGLDGTVMIWQLAVRPKHLAGTNETSYRHEKSDPFKSPSALQPLRRVLSKSEISDFQKSLESTEDPHTPKPMQHQPLSRIHKKASRSTLSNKQDAVIKSPSDPFVPSAVASIRRKPRRNRTQTPPSPNITAFSKSCRPSSNERHQVTRAGGPDGLNSSAEYICSMLRAYRKKLGASTEILKPDVVQDLEHELNLLSNAVKERATWSQETKTTIPSELLDEYLARIIDERLAVKAQIDSPTEPHERAELSPKADYDVES